MRIWRIVYFLVLGWTHTMEAQFYWQNYTTQNIYNDFAQTGDNIWIATQGGLIRYETLSGKYQTYLPWNSPLKGKDIVDLAVGNDMSLWVGTNGGGLFNYKEGVWTRYHDFIELESEFNTVKNINVRPNGDVWFSLAKGGCSICHKLFRLHNGQITECTGIPISSDGISFTSFEFKDDDDIWLFSQRSFSIYNISSQKIIETYSLSIFTSNPNKDIDYANIDLYGDLILYFDTGIFKFDGVNKEILWSNGESIYSSFRHPDGRLFMAYYTLDAEKLNFLVFDGKNINVIYDDHIPPIPGINTYKRLVHIDNDGHYWLLGYNSQLWVEKNNTWISVETKISDISSNYVREMESDCNNSIWIATGGVDLIKNGEWERLNIDTLNNFFTGDIALDPIKCGVWISNIGNSFDSTSIGLVYYENGEITKFLHGHSNVFEVKVTKKGVVYVFSWGKKGGKEWGLGKYENGVWTWYDKNNSPITSSVYGMSLDKNDNLYMTVSKTGLVKFDGQKFYYLGHGQAVPTKYYLNYVDNDGHVWMNNDAGLTMFNGSEWVDYSSFFSYDVVSEMIQDDYGNYWVSTYGDGLYYWDKESLINYNTENSGLRSNYLYDIHIDKNNKLWITESIGITSCEIYSYGNTEKIVGLTYFDRDKSATYNPEIDSRLPGQKVWLDEAQKWSYSNAEGIFTHYPNSNGEYTIEIRPIEPWKTTTESSLKVEVPQQNDVSFGLNTDALPRSVSLSLTSAVPICYSDFNVWLHVVNKGIDPIMGAITIVHSPKIKLNSTLSPWEVINDSTIQSQISFDKPFESNSFVFSFESPDEMSLGDEIYIWAQFVSGTYTSTSEIRDTVLCAYDPNDKKASPTGLHVNNRYLIKDPIRYTIRFENEGNYKATDIIIVDSLHTNLDADSFQFISSSHPCDILIDTQGIVKFIFKNINLPAKSENNTLSQGYVDFTILSDSDIAVNTEIANTAYIYFDSNPPIVTNTTNTIVVDNFGYVNTIDGRGITVVYPNPSTGIINIHLQQDATYSIHNNVGDLIDRGRCSMGINQMVISPSPGIYFVQFVDLSSQKVTYAKVIVQ